MQLKRIIKEEFQALVEIAFKKEKNLREGELTKVSFVRKIGGIKSGDTNDDLMGYIFIGNEESLDSPNNGNLLVSLMTKVHSQIMSYHLWKVLTCLTVLSMKERHSN